MARRDKNWAVIGIWTDLEAEGEPCYEQVSWFASEAKAVKFFQEAPQGQTFKNGAEVKRETNRLMVRIVRDRRIEISEMLAKSTVEEPAGVPKCPKCGSRKLSCENGCTWEI